MRTVRAADLGQTVLDEVERTGEPVTILRGDRPVALLVPTQAASPILPQRSLLGTVEIVGDIIEPVLPPEAWDAEAGRSH
jgi:antitoxin (DNA-binding transcriptional repressor) of toxin-antitoxin stability system